MAGQDGFRAFISYSHDDQAEASRIHKALETYRVPARLVGLDTSKGPVPHRLTPIFRDREDLPASGDLSESVRSALAQSQTLIVLCSPSAARSRWVEAEIRIFREVNPDGDILAAIIAGEPGAQAGGHSADLECFPPALLGSGAGEAEPVAADFRPSGDGRRMALLKLVAGLLDLRLDQLIQRDLQRRQRRVTVITGALAALTLVMATLTVFAVTARSEAERRKAEAEDLIEFMLSDLRTRLEPVGRLDVLDAVGAKVIEYYDGQSARNLSLDDLGRRARAFHLLGEIDSDMGDLESAYRNFNTAYEATSRIIAVDPNEPGRIYEHAQSAFWVGYFAWRRNELETTEARFIEYRDLSERLLSHDSENLEWQAEAAYAHSNLGTLYIDQDRLAEARVEMRQALARFLTIAEASGDSEQAWIDVADAYGWIAFVSEPVEGREAAMAAVRDQIEVYETHLSDADNWSVRRSAMAAEYALARLHIVEGVDAEPQDVADALDLLRTASFEADALIRHDPANVEWRLLGIRQRVWLAEANLLAGNIDAARQAYLDATSFMAHESWADVQGIRFEDTRLQAALIESRLFIAMGDLDSAGLSLAHLLTSLQQIEDWSARLSKGTYLYAATANSFADLLERQGNMQEAARIRAGMVHRLSPLMERLPLDTRAELRRAEARLGAERISAE
ncbi:toll/interleukin-1 receptor domain-containing protein [Maricaulis parjimensis]|uniref:toll/interleukin-1 receptor domain-containing protein n=1 Tax=Maricaulis parjimensis TaxID=144023 RepID=UPI0019393929|nr:toll/interleukin-1 receptor domain-containing protein [Maricaulis parjimensis]